jgi:hypothetical protein
MRRGVVGGLSRASVADTVAGPPSRAASSAVFGRAAEMIGQDVRYPAYELPRTLFIGGTQGVWYDPSDLSTMFQDELGNVPVTGVEQPVRRILDKSGNGNHATASADARRPVLSARVNVLERTEEFDNAYWTLANVSVTPNAETAPNGTQTADLLISNSGFPVAIRRAQTFSTTTRVTVVLYVKKTTVTRLVEIVIASNANLSLNRNRIYVNPETGVASSLINIVSSSSTDVGNGWFRITMVADPQFSGSGFIGITAATDLSAGDLAYIWGMDLRVTNDGVGLPVYQRVTSATDYDTAGFPLYLAFDGTDDCLFTGNIDFTATNKVTVCAGVRKLSDEATGNAVELSANSSIGSNIGSFAYFIPTGIFTNSYNWLVNVTTGALNLGANDAFPAPRTGVISGTADIGARTRATRLNGALVASGTASLGTGNFGTYPLFIGARNNASNRFNGRLYQLVIRGALTGTPVLEQLEGFVNAKTQAY